MYLYGHMHKLIHLIIFVSVDHTTRYTSKTWYWNSDDQKQTKLWYSMLHVCIPHSSQDDLIYDPGDG